MFCLTGFLLVAKYELFTFNKAIKINTFFTKAGLGYPDAKVKEGWLNEVELYIENFMCYGPYS